MKNVRIVINPRKPGAKKILEWTQKMLVDKGFRISKKPDFVIAMGGDGTLLSVANSYGKKGTPILGVNLGGLGFLTDITFEELPAIIDEVKKRRFRIEQRLVLSALFNHSVLYGLNDLTICTRIPGRVVEFSAVINKEYLCRFVADGIIVATPTGSTAYSLATGGPILLPYTDAIILTPISAHTLSVRPIVLPADTKIEIQVGTKGRAILVADGQRSRVIKKGEKIKFGKANYRIKLLKPLHTKFFKTLREKLKWGGREDA